jgi:hypothetical protein
MMPVIQTYNYTDRSLEEQATQIKNILADFIFAKGMISVEDADDLRDNYAIIIRKPSFFRRLVGKYRKTEDKPSLIIVRQETLGEPNEEDANPPVKLVQLNKELQEPVNDKED